MVPADELLHTLWPDTVVTPGSLNRAVSHARRAIGDTHRGRLIKSISRRGYRFSGEVVALDRAPGAPVAKVRERPFVGRSDARAKLRDAFAGAVSRREGALVLISGPPGIGKTRLTEIATAELEAAGALALIGRAREGEGVPGVLAVRAGAATPARAAGGSRCGARDRPPGRRAQRAAGPARSRPARTRARRSRAASCCSTP